MKLALVGLGLAMLAGCITSEGPDCGGTATVGGTWDYHAIQTTPAPGASLTGTVEISSVQGCEFTGDMSVTETPNGGGTPVSKVATLNGIAISDSAVNFDAELNPGVSRTHFVDVFGDSMAGNWVEGIGTDAPRGTFWAKRTAP